MFPAASLWCIQMRNISSPLFCPFCFLLFSMGFWWKALWHYICVMAFQSIAHSVSLAVRPRDSDDLVLVLSKQHCIAFGFHVYLVSCLVFVTEKMRFYFYPQTSNSAFAAPTQYSEKWLLFLLKAPRTFLLDENSWIYVTNPSIIDQASSRSVAFKLWDHLKWCATWKFAKFVWLSYFIYYSVL